MAGPSGLGTVPSSRLTKILQEKAALLKKQRETAEQVLHEVQARLDQLEALDLAVPEMREKERQIQEPVRRSDWPTVEALARALDAQIVAEAPSLLEKKRQQVAERGDRLVQFGLPLPAEFAQTLRGVKTDSVAADWSKTLDRLSQLDEWIRKAQGEYSAQLRTRARAFAEWAGETPEALGELDGKLRRAVEPVADGHLAEGLERVNQLLLAGIPDGARHRDTTRSMGTEILSAGGDLGVPTKGLETALQVDAEASPLDWPTTVVAVEAEAGKLTEALREKVGQAVQALGRTLASLKEYDVDPTASLVVVENLGGQVPAAGPMELPKLLRSAREATEEPVVGIVASLLDGVRPKLVEARRLGRDPSEVFQAMNRAREALRLKIYSEALAASQEAVDRVSRLTADLDAARAESDSLHELLSRLAASRFPTAPFEEELDRIASFLDRVELEPARTLLASTIRRLGGETVAFFSNRFAALDRVFQVAKDRGFLPPDTEPDLARARQLLENGQLAEAAELASTIEVKVRTAAGPYVARRVEELESGFREVPDESLVAPVRRLLADADVNLRVKEDLPGSFESLRRAEREFSAVFAAHASTLVEMLEEERKVLEAMGGTGDEIQRQIDEVQQIFNMGDFVKASRTSQEIRTRAQQQQLVRSEEALSHAKLALVELGKMGLETGALRSRLESAQLAARDRRFAEAYRIAHEVEEGAGRTKAAAQRVLDRTAAATELLQRLKDGGASVEPFREKLRLARTAYQALDFDQALTLLGELDQTLAAVRSEGEARRLVAEAQLLTEDAQRLGLDVDPTRAKIAEVTSALGEGYPDQAETTARALHADLIQVLRPVLSERLRTIEQDLEVARSAGLQAPEVIELAADARRRLTLPVPSGVAEVLEQARTKLVETRGFLEHAERVVRRARDALSEAELAHVSVRDAADRFQVIQAALANQEYPRAIELASTLERDMMQATTQQVGRTIASFQASLARARHGGTDVAVAENLLRQARAALEEGRAIEALQKTTLAAGELERVELQVRIAQGSIEAMERALASAQQEGVRAPAAEQELALAREALANRAYADVLEQAMQLSDALETAREGHRRAREALDTADRHVKEALQMGADVQDVVPRLERARQAQQAGAYPDAGQFALEAAEAARWSLERQYTSSLTEVRALLETARGRGVETGLDGVAAGIAEAEDAFGVRDWSRATDALGRARSALREALTAHVTTRATELAGAGGTDLPPAEAEARVQLRARVDDATRTGDFARAFELMDAELARQREHRRRELQARLGELKDRLWIGEKLGLDTTPVMELFSEARLAVEAGRFDPVEGLVTAADERLKSLVHGRINEKLDEVTTELNFAREGLHVAVDPVARSLETVGRLERDGQVLLAGRALLDAEDELNRRKALHRELMNLHYLIDAALARAMERHVDTSTARALLEESIQARVADYAIALTKAREALQQLQSLLKTPETPTGFWAIRRPPKTPSG